MEVGASKNVVLRVPVLCVSRLSSFASSHLRVSRYGPAPNNSDTAVNILIDVVSDQSGKKYNMDHYATRYPTNVVDIADFLVRLAGMPFSFLYGLQFEHISCSITIVFTSTFYLALLGFGTFHEVRDVPYLF